MRLYWEIARRGYRRYAAYPAATAAGLFTNVFFGFVIAYVMLEVFEQRDDVNGYDVRDTITFVWLAQGLLAVVASFGPSWFELALRVRSGDVATDLQRPVDLQRMLLAEDLGRAAYQALYRAVPPFLLGSLVFDVVLPDPLRLLAFAASVCLAIVVSFAIRFLFACSAFWVLDFAGVRLLGSVLAIFFSGLALPLVIFPGPLRELALLLPWASFLQTPADIWLGHRAGWELVGGLGLQVGWAVALLGACAVTLRAATRKVVVQGG